MSDTELNGISVTDATSRLTSLLGSDPAEVGGPKTGGLEPIANDVTDIDDVDNASLDFDGDNPAPSESAPEKASVNDRAKEPETAIQPPASWDAEAKEAFKKLSPDLQRVVAQREGDRDKGVQQRLQEVASERQAIEAQRALVAEQRQRYETHLQALATQLESSVPKEFQDIRSPQDFVRVSTEDPARAARFMAWREYASSVVGQLQQAQTMRQQEQAQQHEALIHQEFTKLTTAFPEFADPEKGKAWRSEIVSLLQNEGFNQQEIDGLADHRIVLHMKKHIEMQRELSALKKAQEDAKKKLDRTPQRVVSPQRGEGDNTSLDRATSIRIARGGDRGQVQAALTRLLNNS
jgi:hypothetical protein